jgi:hypothetical protein
LENGYEIFAEEIENDYRVAFKNPEKPASFLTN